jgi:hypothetical protein
MRNLLNTIDSKLSLNFVKVKLSVLSSKIMPYSRLKETCTVLIPYFAFSFVCSDMTPCSPRKANQYFERAFPLHIQNR